MVTTATIRKDMGQWATVLRRASRPIFPTTKIFKRSVHTAFLYLCVSVIWGKITIGVWALVCRLNKCTLLWWTIRAEVPSMVSTHQAMHPGTVSIQKGHIPPGPQKPLSRPEEVLCLHSAPDSPFRASQAITQFLTWFLLPNPAEMTQFSLLRRI